MPESFDQRLANIAQKAQMLSQRYNIILQQRDEAYKKIELMQRQIDEDRKLIDSLNTRLEFLKMASNIENSAGDIDRTRAFLTELVWEIDKCIALLND